LCAVR